jgi:ureidoglycolate lyase
VSDRLDSRGVLRVVRVDPLTREAFAPYGQVIDGAGVEPVAINDGTAAKFAGLATVELARSGAGAPGEAVLSIYRAEPRRPPLALRALERHPLGSQAFVPLRPTRYLVVVAGSGDRPAAEAVRAFLATGQQGVNLRAGVWHHALLALEPCDFLVVERREGGENLEVVDVGAWGVQVAC